MLTSKDTFSGGEEFAYNLKTRQRATLIGEPTGGGAHPGGIHRLHPHFEAFIPGGRPVSPITGTNWEGTGVIPDIPADPEQALPVAQSASIKAVTNSVRHVVSKQRLLPAAPLAKAGTGQLKLAQGRPLPSGLVLRETRAL